MLEVPRRDISLSEERDAELQRGIGVTAPKRGGSWARRAVTGEAQVAPARQLAKINEQTRCCHGGEGAIQVGEEHGVAHEGEDGEVHVGELGQGVKDSDQEETRDVVRAPAASPK